MHTLNIIVWGFAGTLLLATIMTTCKYFGLTRMDLPFLLGTMFTSNRNRAQWVGFIVHLFIGWVFAILYAAAFMTASLQTLWFGLTLGFAHAAFVLTVGLQIVNYLHPRMARPFQGPTPTRHLQPPGFMALNYGKSTPAITILAHMVFGGILALFL